MTLILSHLCNRFVSQTSDRLVTRIRPAASPVPFDALANKTIIYWASDAIVSMSYTGSAYVGNLPTDDWIVQTLTGINVSERFGMRTGLLPQWLDIGQATRLLLRELLCTEIAHNNINFQLVIVGWQWKNGGRPAKGRCQSIPMAWGLSKSDSGEFENEVQRLPRHWHWTGRSFFVASPEANLPTADRDEMFAEIREGPKPGSVMDLVDQIENATVNTIRRVSAANPYVGPNCMSVVIAPPHCSAFVRIRFAGFQQHLARLVGSAVAPMIFPAVYSPWIVGQGMVCKPSVHIGRADSEIRMGPFSIRQEGAAGPEHGLLAATSSQQRPPRPIR